ncbi:MAG: hypothetical protein BMS9Abin08_1304 [Gammaproteobacteria bacterium]|nr:MAG: hypothetical protein BMS9Abin08_1304 [Gammaproteobacteria bacterium]
MLAAGAARSLGRRPGSKKLMLDVYRTFYKMTGDPFRLSPDHRFSLAHSSYANAMSYLQYAIFQGEGFVAVTGGPGTGKTTLISDLIEGLDKEHIEVAMLTSTQLESRDLLQMVVNLFDLHPEDMSKPGLLQELEQFLNQQSHKGRRVILIVDEAQGLIASALEELRLLANLQRNHQLLLQVFLVGQEKLLEMLRSPDMEHLHQRLIAASHLQSLGFDEVIDYIEHRLSCVGWKGDPKIDEGALRLIHKYSGGIPRRINLICNRLFLYGGLEQKHELVVEDARLVVEELHKEFLLSPESADENKHEEVAEPGGNVDAPVRSLPRRDMNAATARASEQPSVPEPGKKPVEKVSPEVRPQPRRVKPTPDKARRASSPAEPIEPTMCRQPTIGAARPAPAPKPERPGKSRSWGKAAAFVVLAGVVYAALYGGEDSSSESVSEDRNEMKPRVAYNAPLDAGAPFQKPVSGKVEAVPAKTVATEGLSPTKSAAVTDAETRETLINSSYRRKPVSNSLKPLGSGIRQNDGKKINQSFPGALGDDLRSAKGSTEAPSPDADADSGQDGKMTSSATVVSIPPEPAIRTSKKESATISEAPEVKKPDDSIKVASAQPSKPVETVKREPVQAGKVSIEAEKARLRREAELRLAMNLSRDESGRKTAVPVPVKVVPAPVPVPNKKLTPPPVSSKPKAPVRVATAPKIKTTPKRSPLDQLKAALIEGQWTSRGKPASLLPSSVTYCNSQGERIACQSVPQDTNTKYGAALYKVETMLKEFSAGQDFRLSYRTLVKLLGDDSDSSRDAALSSNTGWQVSEYSMSCQLTRPDQVLCRDNKGVTRDYRRSTPAVMN